MQADILRVPVGPGAMHVERYGHGGTAVLLLHGFGTYNFLWRNVAPALTEAGHTAYAIDLLGHGQSDRPPGADYGIAEQAEYLDAAMTAMRVARAVVVGVDFGGDVAMRLAATRSDRVEKLVLINTPAFDDLPAKDITRMQRRTAKFAFRLSRGVMGAAPLLEDVLKGSVGDPEKMPMKLIARYLAPFVGPGGANHLLTLGSSINHSDIDEDDIKDIHAPTLIIWGEKDRWCDSRVADKLAATIPDARLVKLAGVGRLVPEERPEELSKLLVDFIRKRAAA